MIDMHHLLECILWPNGDGTFRKIINPYKRLEKLGVYKDYKLTIPIEHGLHQTMHHEFKKGTEYELKLLGEKHPMYGKTRDKHNSWKGDKAGVPAQYVRAKKLYQSGQMTEEEFQSFRDAVNEYNKQRKIRKKANLLP